MVPAHLEQKKLKSGELVNLVQFVSSSVTTSVLSLVASHQILVLLFEAISCPSGHDLYSYDQMLVCQILNILLLVKCIKI